MEVVVELKIGITNINGYEDREVKFKVLSSNNGKVKLKPLENYPGVPSTVIYNSNELHRLFTSKRARVL